MKERVYNWETKELTIEELLLASHQALSEIPNKRLKNNDLGFPNTYAIASAIEAKLRGLKETQ